MNDESINGISLKELKKPMNPFLLFQEYERDKFIYKYPEKSIFEITRELETIWQNLFFEKKLPFILLYQENKKIYDYENEIFLLKLKEENLLKKEE